MKLKEIFLKFTTIFKRNKESDDNPPWLKVTKEGKMYNDTDDERYRKYFTHIVSYHNQWKIKDGNLVRVEHHITKPYWKDYI